MVGRCFSNAGGSFTCPWVPGDLLGLHPVPITDSLQSGQFSKHSCGLYGSETSETVSPRHDEPRNCQHFLDLKTRKTWNTRRRWHKTSVPYFTINRRVLGGSRRRSSSLWPKNSFRQYIGRCFWCKESVRTSIVIGYCVKTGYSTSVFNNPTTPSRNFPSPKLDRTGQKRHPKEEEEHPTTPLVEPWTSFFGSLGVVGGINSDCGHSTTWSWSSTDGDWRNKTLFSCLGD